MHSEKYRISNSIMCYRLIPKTEIVWHNHVFNVFNQCVFSFLCFDSNGRFEKKKTWIAIRCCSLVRFRRSRLWLGEWRFFTSELCKVITSAASAFAFLLSFYFVFVCFIKNNFNNLDCSVVTGKSQTSAYCIDLASLRQCCKASSVQF